MYLKNKKIVCGSCWYNESVEMVIDFFIKSKSIFSKININYLFVVFDAKINRDKSEILKLKEKVDCLVISNQIECFPNKNYGVFAITKYADLSSSDIVAIIDPDWKVENYDEFLSKNIDLILNKNIEVIIPDIKESAGRSNVILGKSILNLLYPNMLHIKTPFPGVLIAKTECMMKIVTSTDYHFDWGGEWDIISICEKNNFKVDSPNFNILSTRHRSSFSKTNDSFQIWRAVFQNVDQEKIDNVKNLNIDLSIPEEYMEILNSLRGNATSQFLSLLKLKEKKNLSLTICQLFNMVLLPLAYLLDGNDLESLYPLSSDDEQNPYDKDEMNIVSNLAIYSVREAIINVNIPISLISNRIKEMKGGFLGNWNQENIKKAKCCVEK